MQPTDYTCPLCQQELTLADKTYRCSNNHCFDMAKEGYVNLLPVQHKHSKDPGDNKAMVIARRAFLDKGFYQPLIDSLLSLYQQYGNESLPLLDAGCGEGFYTNQYRSIATQVYGIDIAKSAIKIAAKRYRDCHFSVGTLSQLPFTDEHIGWINSIYAPILETEFTRVLTTGGYLVTVTPAEQHLYELKQLIYRDAKFHDISKSAISALTLIEEQQLNYEMTFSQSDDIINLLAMTPFAFKASDDVVAKLRQVTAFTCQADFMIRIYRKDGIYTN